MGSAAIDGKDALTDALSDSDEVVRGESALAIGNLGIDVPEAVPRLIGLLTDEEEFIHDGESMEVRTAAKTALEQIGSDAVPGGSSERH
jgi:HEAT repeat protein